MKERPILFKGEMVRAILEGRKTQTRRVIKFLQGGSYPQYHIREIDASPQDDLILHVHNGEGSGFWEKCPYGKVGDRLWVRETWANGDLDTDAPEIVYRADEGENRHCGGKWKPSIFMPRWASRITLEITDIRVERLQDISEQEAELEGTPIEFCQDEVSNFTSYKHGFLKLWDSINGEESTDANPWVWVVEFMEGK